MINVLMIDSDLSIIKEVKQYFSNRSSINISKVSLDGEDALKKLESNNYDVILMDPILPKLDGIEILKVMNEKNISGKVIIYSNYNNLNMIKMIAKYNISFFLLKSINLDILEERIIDATKISYDVYDYTPNDMHLKISKLLHDLGMPSHIKGYQYIRDAIIMMHNDPSLFGGITKEIYPSIASKYNTTSSRVERAMRHAIEVSWARGDYDLMDDIFGHSVDFDRAKPTNSEFLATLADKISLDSKSFANNK